jgi:hypothetical protein
VVHTRQEAAVTEERGRESSYATGSYTAFFVAGAALSGVAALMAWAISETPATRAEAAAA